MSLADPGFEVMGGGAWLRRSGGIHKSQRAQANQSRWANSSDKPKKTR